MNDSNNNLNLYRIDSKGKLIFDKTIKSQNELKKLSIKNTVWCLKITSNLNINNCSLIKLGSKDFPNNVKIFASKLIKNDQSKSQSKKYTVLKFLN